MTRMHHYDNLGTARFITFSCHDRRALLVADERIESFLEELKNARQKYLFKLLGYVVMPNHVHLVIYPSDDIKIGSVIGEIKSRAARRIGAILKSQGRYNRDMVSVNRDGSHRFVLWKRRCYDHNCRTPDTVREKIRYCHMNPVKAGLVADAAEWPWSSYRWYMGYKDAVLEIDGIEL